jgi:hypothetical protein
MPNRLSHHFDLGFQRPADGSTTAAAGPPAAQSGAPSERAGPREPIGVSPPPAAAPIGRRAIPLAAALGALVLIGLMILWLRREPRVESVPHTELPVPADTAAPPPSPGPDSVVVVPASRKSPVLWLVLGAVGAIVGVGLLALLTATLRRFENPLPWQLVCWTLLTFGILARHLLVPGVAPPERVLAETSTAPSSPADSHAAQPGAGPVIGESRSDFGGPFDVRSLLLSAALGLAIFPYTMRRLNQLRPQPGLEHVALPFGLGFFLDLAQVTALHWVPKLAG